MPNHRNDARQDEWNAFVLRFLMHHGQESQRHARRLEMLESTLLRLCEDAPPTASFALHKAASDLRSDAQRRAAEAEDSLKQVEELASMAYRFLSHGEAATGAKAGAIRKSSAQKTRGKHPVAQKKKASKKKR